MQAHKATLRTKKNAYNKCKTKETPYAKTASANASSTAADPLNIPSHLNLASRPRNPPHLRAKRDLLVQALNLSRDRGCAILVERTYDVLGACELGAIVVDNSYNLCRVGSGDFDIREAAHLDLDVLDWYAGLVELDGDCWEAEIGGGVLGFWECGREGDGGEGGEDGGGLHGVCVEGFGKMF